jgi:hypothetical protein
MVCQAQDEIHAVPSMGWELCRSPAFCRIFLLIFLLFYFDISRKGRHFLLNNRNARPQGVICHNVRLRAACPKNLYIEVSHP